MRHESLVFLSFTFSARMLRNYREEANCVSYACPLHVILRHESHLVKNFREAANCVSSAAGLA